MKCNSSILMSAFVVSASVFVGFKSKRPPRVFLKSSAPLSPYFTRYGIILGPRCAFAYCVLVHLHVRFCCVAAQAQEKAMKVISVSYPFVY